MQWAVSTIPKRSQKMWFARFSAKRLCPEIYCTIAGGQKGLRGWCAGKSRVTFRPPLPVVLSDISSRLCSFKDGQGEEWPASVPSPLATNSPERRYWVSAAVANPNGWVPTEAEYRQRLSTDKGWVPIEAEYRQRLSTDRGWVPTEAEGGRGEVRGLPGPTGGGQVKRKRMRK